MRDLKLSLARALAPAATAIMIDAEFGGQALEAGVVPASVAIVMPLEAQGYEAGGDDRITTSPARLLPDRRAPLGRRRVQDPRALPGRRRVVGGPRRTTVIAATAGACHDLGLPLVVEPVVYHRSTEARTEFTAAYEALVVGAVDRIQPLGADLLKLPFPLPDLGGRRPVAGRQRRALPSPGPARDTPWVLLGAGADTDTFVEQIRLAGMAGASGFLAGRGIWGPALSADPGSVELAASGPSLASFRRCRDAAERHARPLPAFLAG